MRNFRFYGDFWIWVVFFVLSAVSIVEVYSAGSFLTLKEGNIFSPLFNHGSFLLASAVLALAIHHVPCRIFKLIPLTCGIPVIGLLVYVLLWGKNLNNGARWLSIMGISFQPSELAKIVLIVFVALTLATSQGKRGASKAAFWSILIFTGIVSGLIVTQNFSTAALIGLVIFLMLIVGRAPKKLMFGFVLSVLVSGGLAFASLMALPSDPHDPFYDSKFTQRLSTWRARLTDKSMVVTPDPRDFELNDRNRQVVNARIALASAQGTGRAPGRSVQRDYLSAAYSDFIFAIIGEELGLLGCAIVVAAYMLLLYRAKRIASQCEHNFPAFLIMGLALMIVTQAVINMCVAVGLFPVTGQTLPLVSKGGTSTIITGIYFGMMLSVSRYARRKGEKPLAAVAEEETPELAAAYTAN